MTPQIRCSFRRTVSVSSERWTWTKTGPVRQAGECREYACRLRAAQRILNGIESLTMRAFVMMKYVMGLRDGEIRQQLNMTRRGFERARQSVEDAPDMASVKWRERYIVSEDT